MDRYLKIINVLITCVFVLVLCHDAFALAPSTIFPIKINHQKVKEEILASVNITEFLRSGALVFDIDGTILKKKGDTLSNYPAFCAALLFLMRHGVRITIISGNSVNEQLPRIVHPLKSILGNDLSPLKNFTLYANGGATRVDFDEYGQEKRDNKYCAYPIDSTPYNCLWVVGAR